MDMTENALMMRGGLNWVRRKNKVELPLKVKQNV
jgi:hypothetical protein